MIACLHPLPGFGVCVLSDPEAMYTPDFVDLPHGSSLLCLHPSVARKCFNSEYHQISSAVREVKELLGLSPRANYTDRATAACRRS
jgi:hypothetical protein